MTQHPETPEQDPRREAGGAEGSGSFTFADKRRVDPTDGTVRPSGPSSPSSQDPGQGSEQGTPGGPASRDPIDAEAASLYEQASQDRADAPEDGDGSVAPDPRVGELEKQVADLSEELKRAQAEYVNSRRRIEAGAQASVQSAIARVLTSLIGVLDDVELGRQHGDITEGTPFHSIAAKLEDSLRAHGLERYGAPGEPFNPSIHEALMHEAAEDVEETTISTVMQPGYRMGERVLRPARVATRGPQ